MILIKEKLNYIYNLTKLKYHIFQFSISYVVTVFL